MYKDNYLPKNFWGRKALQVALVSSLLVVSNAHATGFGRITIQSALGQPLRAEIELTAPTKEEMASLQPKLASMEAFKKAGIEFHPALLSLRFVVEPKGSGYVIRVTSSQAINEPFLEFLVEMTSGNGRVMREYTFLLDPAELSTSQAPQISQASSYKPLANTASRQTQNESKSQQIPQAVSRSENATNTVKPVEKVALEKKLDAQEYRVKSGDTLVKIAASKMPGVSLDQVLVSIYNANPNAFVGNNMNRLKAGQVITLPSTESVQEVTKPQAQTIVRAHASDFNAYRNKLAGHVSEMSLAKPSQSKSAATGVISAKVKELPTASNEALDKLKLSKLESTKGKSPDLSKETAEIERIAKAKADQENSNRIKELEKNVNELNKLLEIKNRDLAIKQNAASAPASKVEIKADAKTEVKQDANAKQEPNKDANKNPIAEQPVLDSASKSASLAEVGAASTAKPKKPRPAPPAPPPVEETNWLSSTYLLPAAGVLGLLAGLGLYISNRRKKKTEQFDDSSMTGSNLKSNSLFGSTGGQSVDTNNSVFNSNFAPSASQLDANEVDPVAEADVYIAYGRDAQAEDILKEALRTQPDRHAVRLKLLEIYFTRKDARAFELYAGDLYGMTAGQGPDWAQASAMGKGIDPSNPLYAGAQGEAPAPNASMGSPTLPLEDLNSAAMMESALSEDMLDSISIIDIAAGLSEEKGSLDKSFEQNSSPIDSGVDVNALDFDLGIEVPDDESPLEDKVENLIASVPDEPELSLNDEPQIVTASSESDVPEIDFGSIDFDLGDDIAEPAAVSEEAEFSHSVGLDWAANENVNVAVSEEVVPQEVAIESDLDSLLMESEESVTPSLELTPPSFDLAGINFDLPESNQEVQEVVSSMPEILISTQSDFEVEGIDEQGEIENAEMATKLDLALAYQEIGDKEGARELLEEVKLGGTKGQQSKAAEMLSALS
jgi:pilus assembly protein FimV